MLIKNCGPLRLPAQYPRKIIAMTVDFLVKPAMLLADSESMRGNAGATAIMSQKPANRASFSTLGRSLIMRIPAMAMMYVRTRAMCRDLRT